MAQSQEVNANNAALASQYNNLRKDVLDPTLGHDHSGAADTGKRIVPVGLIAMFAADCPTGWTEYTAAQGRVVVGVPAAGTVAGTVGTALANLGTRTITDVPAHSHTPSPLKAITTGGTGTALGVNSNWSYEWTTAYSQNTGSTGIASVDVTMPYIQLRFCQKT